MPAKPSYHVPVDARTIGRRLAFLRKMRGITQVELAEQLGMIQALVSDYERGKLRLHGGLIVAFAQALRVSSDEILGIKQLSPYGPFKDRRFLRRLEKIDKLPAATARCSSPRSTGSSRDFLTAPDLAGTPRASTTRRPSTRRARSDAAPACARGHALSRAAQDQPDSAPRAPAASPRAGSRTAEAAIARELGQDGQLAHDRGVVP